MRGRRPRGPESKLVHRWILPGHAAGCAHGAALGALRVTRVERVENMTLWKNYQRERQALRERLSQHRARLQKLKDVPAVARLVNGERVLDAGTNEFWLWHGTKPPLADILATSGFDERVASLGGLYGAGSYFADAMCKSNQYATETNAGGEHCMLYCRVTVGCAYRTAITHVNERRPPDNAATPGAPHDSIFAETGVGNGGQQSHNEFVCFSKEQVYPEFIVWYTT